MGSVKLTTTGTLGTVIIGGRVFNHPTTDFELLDEFSLQELAEDQSLDEAIALGQVTLEVNGSSAAEVDLDDGSIFLGTNQGTGEVPDDGQSPSGRVLNDRGQWVLPGSKWKDYATSTGPINPEGAYITLVNYDFDVPETKDYEYKVSFGWELPDPAEAMELRLKINNSQEFYFKIELKDKNNKEPFSYSYIKQLTAGTNTFLLQAKRSGGNKQLSLEKIMIKLEEV